MKRSRARRGLGVIPQLDLDQSSRRLNCRRGTVLAIAARVDDRTTSDGASTTRPDLCAHCERSLAGSDVRSGALGFCCTGCRLAHQLVRDGGLARFYELRRGPGVPVGEVRKLQPDASPAWLDVELERAAPGVLTCDLQGLHCAGCVWLIDTLFRRHEGARHIAIDPGLGRVAMRFDPDRFDAAAFLRDLNGFGYRSGPPRKVAAQGADDLLLRFGVTAAAAANAMMLAVPGYLGLEVGDSDGLHTLFSWVGFGLATLAVVVGGPVFFRGAWRGLQHRVLHLDLPITVAITLAWAGSTWLLFMGRQDAVYFDSVAVFVALMLLGRWLQRRLIVRNRRMLLADGGAGELVARVVADDGRVLLRPVAELVAGDVLLLAPGELVPVAADLLADEGAEVDMAWSTGESEPVAVARGERVAAGAHLASRRAVLASAAEAFGGGALERLLTAPAEATMARDGLWHRVSFVYVAAVLSLAAGAAWAWWGAGELRALEVAIAVLVVTCPCAIGLALPLGRELGAARLRHLGLYVRRVDLFDRLASVTDVLLDKTGTLTSNVPALSNPDALAALTPDARGALFQLVVRSQHPRSRALVDSLGAQIALDPSADVIETPGVGMQWGQWQLVAGASGGTELRIGDRVLATFRFHEPLRADSRRQVAALEQAGLRVHLLSGDEPARVRAAADLAGLQEERAAGSLSPDDKADLVRSLPDRTTLFVGDGINDGPALDAAWCAGTPAVDRPSLPARADFFMLGDRLGPLAELVATARTVRAVTRRNLVFAVCYNVLGVAAAVAGWLSPLACALLMPASSLGVLGATAWTLRPSRQRLHDGRSAGPALVPAVGGAR